MQLFSSRPLLVIGALVVLLLVVLNFSLINYTRNIDDLRMKEITSVQSSSNLAVLTAFSKNHMLEGVAMLRSLIAVQFKGPVYIFLMKEVGEDITSHAAHD